MIVIIVMILYNYHYDLLSETASTLERKSVQSGNCACHALYIGARPRHFG